MLNPAQDLAQGQGLDKTKKYKGTVVNNNDPRQLARIQVRVDTIFDGISDEHLPWAIPAFEHCDGATANSGFVGIPKNGSRVSIKFQGGSPLHPEWSGYTVDETNLLHEAKHNYPDRVVALYDNTCLLIIDTKSKEIFLRNPGDYHFFIEGNVFIQVKGNVTERIKGNYTKIVDGNTTVLTKGWEKRQTLGHYTNSIGGYRRISTKGDKVETVGGRGTYHVDGNDGYFVKGNSVRTGARIDDNPGSGPSPKPDEPSDIATPAFPVWPGVRGNLPE